MVLQHREYQLTKATLISTDYGAGLQIGEFEKKKKKKNTDHKTAKTFKLGVAIKPSGLFFIVNKSQRR